MITAHHVSYSADSKAILQDVSLSIKPGAITAILGPNGAGKSTLLKCLTDTLSPTHGSVTMNGAALSAYSPRALAKKRAVLPQLNPINFPFTAMEIVLMGRHPHLVGSESNRDRDIARETLKLLEVWHLKDRIFSTLSGGEQQRIQLARALVQIWEQQDAYLFLDEPTSAQDIKYKRLIMGVLSSLKDKNIGIACVLHDLNEACAFADTIALLKDGRLVAEEETHTCLNAERIEAVYGAPVEVLYAQNKRPVFIF